jgi:ketosteroid isomerase-like protein
MRRMRWVTMLVSLSACAASPMSPGVAPNAADVAAVTRAKVETWRQLYRTQDAEGLRRFLTDDFVVIDGDGKISTRDAEVAWLAANEWSGPADFRYVVDRITFPAPDVAIVIGHGSGTGSGEGNVPCIDTYRSSNVFRKIEGVWRPALSHISGARCVSRADYDALYGREASR